MKTIYKLFIFTILFSACENKEKKHINNEVSPSKPYFDDFKNQEKMQMLSNKIIEGDTIAYEELKEIYLNSNHYRDFLRNSLLMCNDFHYARAYLDVYFILKTDLINNTNININKLANFYLLKAYEKGVEDAGYSIEERFGDNVKIPKSKDYWLEMYR